jgi:hypothetical protein
MREDARRVEDLEFGVPVEGGGGRYFTRLVTRRVFGIIDCAEM